MLSVKVYLIGTIAVLGAWLSIHLTWWFTLLFAGALTWAVGEYLSERKAARMQNFLDEIEMQKLKSEAQAAQARADLEREAVETARTRRGLIPAGYLGAQLYRPADANLYRVWGNGNSVKVQEEAASRMPGLEPGLPEAANIFELLPTLEHTGGRILFGYDVDGPIWLEISEMLSIAMAGNSGRGKSKALLWLVMQLLKQGVRVSVLDGKGDLRKWLSAFMPVAYTPGEIQRTTDALLAEGARRLEENSGEVEVDMPPWIVVIDELDLVEGRYPRVVKLVEQLTKKTRSVNMHGIYSNQSVPADLVGGVENRGVIVSRICLYCDDEAAQLIGVRKNNGGKALLQQIAPPAPPGLAVARTAIFGWKIIAFPYVPDGAPYHLLPKLAVSPPPAPDTQITAESAIQVTPGGRGKRQLVSEEERQEILDLAAQGLSPAGIATAMHRRNAFADIIRLILQEEESNETNRR